jgi:F-type H+-transporting ATPase subunit a
MLIGLTLVLLLLFTVGLVSGALGASLLKGLEVPDFLSVPRPHVKLPAEEVFHILGFPVTNTILATWLTIVVVAGLFYAATRKIKIVPTGLQNLMEVALETLLNFVESVAGKEKGRRFFPLIATIFFFVLMNAWLSLLPGFGSITAHTAEGETHLLRGAGTDINMPLALALISFVFVEYWGISALGWRYVEDLHRSHRCLRGYSGDDERDGTYRQLHLPSLWQHDRRGDTASGGRLSRPLGNGPPLLWA